MTNAIQFIKDHGVDRARECIEEANGYGGFWVNAKTLELSNQIPSYDAVSIPDIQRLVESVDLVELLGGIELLKRKIDGKHIGYTHFSINGNGRWSFLDHYIDFIPDSAYHIGMVNKAIADYEAIGGEHV